MISILAQGILFQEVNGSLITEPELPLEKAQEILQNELSAAQGSRSPIEDQINVILHFVELVTRLINAAKEAKIKVPVKADISLIPKVFASVSELKAAKEGKDNLKESKEKSDGHPKVK